MKIAVSAETTVDLTKDLLKEFDIHTVPFTVLLGDAARLDGDVDCEEIIDYVAKTGILPRRARSISSSSKSISQSCSKRTKA